MNFYLEETPYTTAVSRKKKMELVMEFIEANGMKPRYDMLLEKMGKNVANEWARETYREEKDRDRYTRVKCSQTDL